MSQPKPPYYSKRNRTTYHWEHCNDNYYPAPGWEKSSEPPAGKEPCELCRAKK